MSAEEQIATAEVEVDEISDSSQWDDDGSEAQEPERPVSDGEGSPEQPRSSEGEGSQPKDTETGKKEELTEEQKQNRWARDMRVENRRLKRELEELKNQRVAAPAAKPTERAPDKFDKPRPRLDSFDTTAEYEKATDQWISERDEHLRKTAKVEAQREFQESQKRAAAERQRKQEEENARKIQERLDEQFEALSDKYDDFREIAERETSAIPNTMMLDPMSGKPVLSHLGHWIKTADSGLEVGYYLEKHPEDAKRIGGLQAEGKIDQVHYELVTLRNRLTNTSGSTESKQIKEVSRDRRPAKRLPPGGTPKSGMLDDDEQWSDD